MNAAKDTMNCRNDKRRHEVRDKQLNGLDYVEVGPTQLSLKVFFIGAAPEELTPGNFRIDGGERITGIRVTKASRVDLGDDELDDHWLLKLDRFGDFSTYTLRIVRPDDKGRPGDDLPEEFDPRYSSIPFNFKTDCPSDFDCLPASPCPPETLVDPEINYLAKDYASFRQLILDRLAVLMPGWTERHVADLGITLVELLAYTGDYLSYYQDAVATEAYLGTSRQRISVRRHARLVDYSLHEGCNARAWVCVETSDELVEIDAADTFFTTRYGTEVEHIGGLIAEEDLRNVAGTAYEVFEPVVKDQMIRLYSAHNEIAFYTWGDGECCLPKGSTRATLLYEWKVEPKVEPEGPPYQVHQRQGSSVPPPEVKLNLKSGDVLIIEEVKGAKTANPADADPTHRHAVRLTKVLASTDDLRGKQIVEVEWAEADALPFTVCISSIGPAGDCCEEISGVSVVRGNVVLVDHGRGVTPEVFDVPYAEEQDAGCEALGQPRDKTLRAMPFSPVLAEMPITHSESFPPRSRIASRQAELLTQLQDDVSRYVRSLWQKASDGNSLATDELSALQMVYGRDAMIGVGLLDPAKQVWRTPDPSDQASAIGNLIEYEDRWLNKKLRRLAVLRNRAEDGYVLDELTAREIGELFGEKYAKQFVPSNPALFGPASYALTQDPRDVLASIRLSESRNNEVVWWDSRRDLLDSRSVDRHFVAEIDDGGVPHLRFGNGELGESPRPGSQLTSSYRVGNGTAGNVGPETIVHIGFRKAMKSGIQLRPRNPMPAVGGTDPEPVAEAKLFAPRAFRKEIQRAVIAEDYARLAERNPKIQGASGSLAWTGSWYEATVAVDPRASVAPNDPMLSDIERRISQYRRIGHNLRVTNARYVPIEIEIKVCVRPHYLRGHVKERLLGLFSDRMLSGGRPGWFHADNLTFGRGVYASELIAAAQTDPGVESALVTKLHRMFEEPNNELENGILPLGPFEIAQVANDPSFPEDGKLTLILDGGR
jgi:predicted phage baseplate assembly protein